MDAVVMGSTTYELLLRTMDSPEDLEHTYGGRPIWFFSARALPTLGRVQVIDATEAEALPLIRESADTVWVLGGGNLAGQFVDAGAPDAIILSIAPVFPGSGRPTMPRKLDSSRLSLIGQRQVGQFVELRYHVYG
jgi:Dihydrofolate reductase